MEVQELPKTLVIPKYGVTLGVRGDPFPPRSEVSIFLEDVAHDLKAEVPFDAKLFASLQGENKKHLIDLLRQVAERDYDEMAAKKMHMACIVANESKPVKSYKEQRESHDACTGWSPVGTCTCECHA